MMMQPKLFDLVTDYGFTPAQKGEASQSTEDTVLIEITTTYETLHVSFPDASGRRERTLRTRTVKQVIRVPTLRYREFYAPRGAKVVYAYKPDEIGFQSKIEVVA